MTKHFLVAAAFCIATAGLASAESGKKYDFEFTNIADTTQGLSDFQTFPAINNKGQVVFVAFRSGVGQGVFRSQNGELTTIASDSDGLRNFGNNVAINAPGVVVFQASGSSGSVVILTGDGRSKRLIADSTANGLSKFGMGSPSINAAGTVAFQSLRSGPGSSFSVFTGDGGPLTTIVSTSKTGFTSFANVAINDAGKIVFGATLADRSKGLFTTSPGATVDIVDTNAHPEFDSFLDPVINNAGTVAGVAFTLEGGVQVFTGNARGMLLRNTPAAPAFTNSEHPSINNLGAVAFYAFPLFAPADPTGIFLLVDGSRSAIPVIRPGDNLFGSTVSAVDLGRFALNDRFELAFQYTLQDGRSGIAMASFHGQREDREQ